MPPSKKKQGKARRRAAAQQSQTDLNASQKCPSHGPESISKRGIPMYALNDFSNLRDSYTALSEEYDDGNDGVSLRREIIYFLISLLERPQKLKNKKFIEDTKDISIGAAIDLLLEEESFMNVITSIAILAGSVTIFKYLDVAKVQAVSDADFLDKAKNLKDALKDESASKCHSLMWKYLAELLIESKARKVLQHLRALEYCSIRNLIIFFSKQVKCGCLDKMKAWVVKKQPKLDLCDYCKKEYDYSQLRHCAGCGISRFCSTDCHKNAWKDGHKVCCKMMQKMLPPIPPPSSEESVG